MLRHRAQHVRHTAVNQAEIACIRRNRHARHPAQNAVKPPCRQLFHRRLAVSLAALAVNDFVSFAPFLRHQRDQFRRVLQIAIDNHNRVAARSIHARAYRHLMAEIA